MAIGSTGGDANNVISIQNRLIAHGICIIGVYFAVDQVNRHALVLLALDNISANITAGFTGKTQHIGLNQ